MSAVALLDGEGEPEASDSIDDSYMPLDALADVDRTQTRRLDEG